MAIVIFRSFFAADWAATLIPFVVCNINYDNFFRRNSFDTDIFYDNAIDTDEFFYTLVINILGTSVSCFVVITL